MKVYTFYGQKESHHFPSEDLVEYWYESWKQAGWHPQVLGSVDIQRTKFTNLFMERVRELPTVNSNMFELWCYSRWLALQQAGGGVMSDYDVINYGLPPQEHTSELESYSEFYWGCVYATGEGLVAYLKEMMTNGKQYAITINGQYHTSDATIGYNYHGTKHRADIRHYMAQDIQRGTEPIKPFLVHYSNNWWSGYDQGTRKIDAIYKFEEQYGLLT